MDCLPDSLKGRSYYQPTQEGREKLLAQRMEEIRRIRSANIPKPERIWPHACQPSFANWQQRA